MPGAVFLVASGSHHLDTRPSRARLRPLVPRSARGLSGIWEGQERGEIGRTGSGQDGSTTPTQPVPRLTQREHPRGTGHPMGRTGRCVSADNAACFRVSTEMFYGTRRYLAPQWCDAHHFIEWSQGGETSLANCVLLCGFHHRLIHKRHWVIEMAADGHPDFLPPAWIDPARRPRRQRRREPLRT